MLYCQFWFEKLQKQRADCEVGTASGPSRVTREWTGLNDDSSEETRLPLSSEAGELVVEMPLAKREFKWVRACVALQKILIVSVAAAAKSMVTNSCTNLEILGFC